MSLQVSLLYSVRTVILYEQLVSLSIAAQTLCNRKNKQTNRQMAARNETTERPSATLVYDMITIIRLINSHIVVVVLGAAKNVGHLNGSRSSCSHYRQHNITKT